MRTAPPRACGRAGDENRKVAGSRFSNAVASLSQIAEPDPKPELPEDELAAVRSIWWRLVRFNRLRRALPAEPGVIVIDGGRL